jgi:hypothetical protein
MAKFSESFLQQLGRPGWSDGMFGLGQAIGGAQGQVRDQRKKQEFNQLMQQIQGAQGSGDFTSMKILAQQLATMDPQEAAKVMQAATALEQKLGLQKSLEGMFTEGVPTSESIMAAGKAALAAGDPQTALALQERATALGTTENQKETRRKAAVTELQGFMQDPRVSKEDKLQVRGVLQGLATGQTDVEAVEPQLQGFRDRFKPKAVGSRAAPQQVEVLEEQPDGSMKKVTKFALQDPVTGKLTYETVGLTPPKEFAPKDTSGAKKGDVAQSARSPWEDMNEVAATSAISLIRNKNLATQIASEPDKATGLVSQVRTKVLDIAGLRDAEENLKTEFLRGVNTEIIGSLPPGVASDRDIEIFSSGFPDDSRSTQQILEYLEVERRFLGALQDKALLAEQFLSTQMKSGQDGNFVGFNAYQRGYSTAMTNLGMNIKEEVAKGADPVQAQQRHIAAFKQAFGFTPAYYL